MVQVTSVTIGLPVSDLDAARRWYEAALQLSAPDLEPVGGVVEYQVGTVWLQLGEEDDARPEGSVLRVGVPDVHAERARLLALGIAVREPEVIDGVIAFCDFEDPDGNLLSFYTVFSPAPEGQ